MQPGTTNLKAYDLYVRGRALLHRRGASLAAAGQAFEEAVAIDPDYAPALAGLARALVLSAFWGMVEPGEVLGRASEAAAHALRSDPLLGEAHAAAALVAFAARFDRQEAEAEWERAIALAKESDADTRITRASFDLGYGRIDFTAAAREITAALEVDPLSSSGYASLAVISRSGGNIQAARVAARRAMELDPESLYANWAMLYSLSGGDMIEEARRVGKEARSRFGRHPWLMMGESVNLPPGADRTEAVARYEELAARSRTDYVQPAVLSATAAFAGRLEESARWLLRALEIRDSLMLALIAQFADLTPVLQSTGNPGSASPDPLEPADEALTGVPRLQCHKPRQSKNSTLHPRHSSNRRPGPHPCDMFRSLGRPGALRMPTTRAKRNGTRPSRGPATLLSAGAALVSIVSFVASHRESQDSARMAGLAAAEVSRIDLSPVRRYRLRPRRHAPHHDDGRRRARPGAACRRRSLVGG